MMSLQAIEQTLHTATGNVKYSGVNCGTQSWKSGGLQLVQRDDGSIFCKMFFATGSHKTFPLSNNVKRVIWIRTNPGKCLIELRSGCNIVIDKGKEHAMIKFKDMVKTLEHKKGMNGGINGVKKSPFGLGKMGQRLVPSPNTRQVKPMRQSGLFSQVGNGDQKSSMNVEDFESKPITKLPLFSDEDEDVTDKENMGEKRLSLTDSEVKKTPYQMRKEEGGNIFLTSCEEKLNLLKEKQNEANSNPVARSFYSRGQMLSSYAATDNFKSYRSNLPKPSKSPGLKLFSPSAKRKDRTFSFKPKSAPRFVARSGSPQKTLQGFSNLGNTCYMNAILQSLYGLEALRHELVHSELSENFPPDSLSFAMKILFIAKLQNKPREVISKLLLRVKDAISKSATRFSGYLQHDAQEFLCQCLDQLKEDTQRLNRLLSEGMGRQSLPNHLRLSSPTAENVEFTVVHTIRCLECGESVTKEELFHDLSLDMPKQSDIYPSTIQVALDQFFEFEDINYTCEKCKGKEARLSHKFSKLSRYIILNLKRYAYNFDSSQNSKVRKDIQIPRYLTLSRHCVSKVQKPCNGEATPTDESAMVLMSSPRRKLSFDSVDGGREGDGKCIKRQRLDMNQGGKSTDQRNDQVFLISDVESGEEQTTSDKDLEAMTEEEQLAYVLKLSQSEVKKKRSNNQSAESMTSPCLAAQSDMLENSNSSLIETDRTDQSHKNKSIESTQAVPDSSSAVCDENGSNQPPESLWTPVKVSTGSQSDANGPQEAATINDLGSNSPEFDKDVSQVEGALEAVGEIPVKEEEDISRKEASKMSREQLQAQEEEELRKATELSLLDQKDATLREEEEIRKAQELSLQEFERHSPPLLGNQMEDESPNRPLYTREEWKMLEQNSKEGDMPNSYQLVSVVSHIGNSLTMGHYVSDVFNSKSKSWLSYDDSNVTVISGAQVRHDRRKTGYIFFYERV